MLRNELDDLVMLIEFFYRICLVLCLNQSWGNRIFSISALLFVGMFLFSYSLLGIVHPPYLGQVHV